MALDGVPATQNHKLNVPEEGYDDWDNPLNDNFDELDRRTPIRDLEENRSEYDPRHNAKFEATDTGKMWYGDGTSWNQYGAIGSTSWSDNGTAVKSDPGDINIGTNLDLVDDGAGAGVTINLEQGAGSGLDADTLDTHDSSEFGILAENESVTGQWTFGSDATLSSDVNLLLGGSDQFGIQYHSGNTELQIVGTPNGTANPRITIPHSTSGSTIDINFHNNDVVGVNNIIVNDTGGGEGFKWSGQNGGMDISDLDGTNGAKEYTRIRPNNVGIALMGKTVVPYNDVQQGRDPSETISESTSPKSFNFSGSQDRDIHEYTVVTISNGTTASATENVTVELYDGTGTTGTLVQSQTKSVTVGASSSTSVTFLPTDELLDTGTYHIEITQSGTTLSIDQTAEYTRGATYTLGQGAAGRGKITNQFGDEVLRWNPITSNATFSTGNLTVSGNLTTEGDKVTTNSTLVVGPGPTDGGDAMIELKPGNNLESQIRWYDGNGVSQVSYWWDHAGSNWHALDQNYGRYLFTYKQGSNLLDFRDVPVEFSSDVNLATSSLSLSGSTALTSVAASGNVSLTSGSADIDLGISASNATFMLALGSDTNDAKVSGRVYLDSTTATYHVEIVENGTSVGNPSVDYDVIRVK